MSVNPISYKRNRFPPDVIKQAVWLYFRFTLSCREVEEMMAARGIDVSYETIRCWMVKFGQLFAQNLRRARCCSTRWNLNEVFVKIRGRQMYLWRAVDDEGDVLDVLVQRRRNKLAAEKLLRKLLKNQGIHPETITTDKLASYGAAMKVLGLVDRHKPGGIRRIIEQKIHICPSGGESESNGDSTRKAQLKGSSQPMQPSTGTLTSNAT